MVPAPGSTGGGVLTVHLCSDVIELSLSLERSPGLDETAIAFPAALTVEGGRLRPARAADDPGSVLVDPLPRLGGPGPVVIGRTPVEPAALAVAVIDHAVVQASERWGRPASLVLAVPAPWTRRRRQALADAATDAGWPGATIVASPVLAARRQSRGRSSALIGVIEVGSTVDTAVVQVTASGGEIVGVALRDHASGTGHLDETLSARVLEGTHPEVRDGLASGGADWLTASVMVRRSVTDARRPGLVAPDPSLLATPAGSLDATLEKGVVASCLRRESAAIAARFRHTLQLAGIAEDRLDAVVVTGPSRHDPGVAAGLRDALGSTVAAGALQIVPPIGEAPAPVTATAPVLATEPLARTEQLVPAQPVRAPRREVPSTAALAPGSGWPRAAVLVIVASILVILASVAVIVVAR